MSYLAKVQIDNETPILIGSSLFGVCSNVASSPTKVINDTSNSTIGPNFAACTQGVTIHIKFKYGNSLTSAAKLQVGATPAIDVEGNFVCAAGAVVAFTYHEVSANEKYWIVNNSVDASLFATAAQGTKADNAMPITGGEFTGPVTINSDITTSSPALSLATKNYVDAKTAGLSGLTGAMHFRGRVSGSLPTQTISYNSYDSGDVILLDNKEYVYYKNVDAASSEWILLGDEGSYALRSNTSNIGSASNWNAGSAATLGEPITADNITSWNPGSTPTLGATITANEITNWSAGASTTASVSNGILSITFGTAPTLEYTDKNIPNITDVGSAPSLEYTAHSIPNVTNGGTAPSLTITTQAVVIP